ncbi:hypothetical protein BCR39DRAFT_557032 [Naematelia encephala]|uniref:Uncharacterized protein n=1 Tax=Naematelia encephala TaxID=71784 RepID=A0A1Y2BH46_9TREE|nr:hypothetical protein BCR39DRAFT_557032 [Naematelia encephala]
MSEPIELQPLGSSKPPLPPRHPDSVPGTLHAAYRAAEEKAKAAVHLQEGALDEISIWALAASAWFSILAVPLLLFPRLLVFFAQTPPSTSLLSTSSHTPDRNHYDTLTPLESFLCLTLSIGLFSTALTTLLCLVPTYTPPTTNPNRKLLLGILVGLTTIMSVLGWDTKRIGGLGVVVGAGNAAIAIWGWWCIVFGSAGSKLVGVGKDKKHIPERFKRL